MTTCPNCGGNLGNLDRAYRNLEAYGDSRVIAAPCCGTGVTVKISHTFSHELYCGKRREDDWGTPLKPNRKSANA